MGVSFAAATLLAPAAAHASTEHHAHAEPHHRVARHVIHHRAVYHESHMREARRHERAHYETHHIYHTAARHEVRHSHAYYERLRAREIRAARFRNASLQCVPYAREISHIDIVGDAFLWWAKAAGRYARGHVPQVGAVLNFRPIHRMPLGHVAVVTAVINSRTILVTQANWEPDTITNDVTIQDVSPDNNWTDVEVEIGDSSKWGSPYPTYGFIYNRPATPTVIARNGQSEQVAEAPAATHIAAEAPNRNLQ